MMTAIERDPMAASVAFQKLSAQAADAERGSLTTSRLPAGARVPSSAATDHQFRRGSPSGDGFRATAYSRAKIDGEALRFDMHEVQHRLKNVVAVIQSICNQTIRHSTTKEDFAKRFSARLFALCDSLDLLIGSDWKGLELHDLVKAQLEPFGLLADGQIVSSGPLITLGPDASRNIGMALHELATNALKHGSLSVSQGKVSLGWQIATRPEGQRFLMTWVEAGGPRVAEPTHRGFGRQVIQNSVGFGQSSRVAYEFLPQGVRWTLDLPASAVVGSPQTIVKPIPLYSLNGVP